MARVFISYSTKDLEFVRNCLQPLMAELGAAAWCSASDIRLAADWERQIRIALAQADWFVVVLSPDALRSEWVQAETHWALEHKRGRVVPVMARGCTPEDLHLKLGTLQYIDFRQDLDLAKQQLTALIGGSADNAATVIVSAPKAEAEPGATVVVPRATTSVLLAIEPSTGQPFERRVAIRHAATIGRLDDADLKLQDECVSRRHAKLSVGNAGGNPALTIVDLDSANGTYVNGQRLLAARAIAVGDSIEIGNARLKVLDIELR